MIFKRFQFFFNLAFIHNYIIKIIAFIRFCNKFSNKGFAFWNAIITIAANNWDTIIWKIIPLEKTCEKLDFIGFLLFDAMGDGEVARKATTLPIQEWV